MNAQSILLSLTFVVLALLIWQLRWVLLVLFGAVVVAVALDVLIHQLQNRSRLARPQALLVVLAGLLLGSVGRPAVAARTDHPDPDWEGISLNCSTNFPGGLGTILDSPR